MRYKIIKQNIIKKMTHAPPLGAIDKLTKEYVYIKMANKKNRIYMS